jgi:hypothetical protein
MAHESVTPTLPNFKIGYSVSVALSCYSHLFAHDSDDGGLQQPRYGVWPCKVIILTAEMHRNTSNHLCCYLCVYCPMTSNMEVMIFLYALAIEYNFKRRLLDAIRYKMLFLESRKCTIFLSISFGHSF